MEEYFATAFNTGDWDVARMLITNKIGLDVTYSWGLHSRNLLVFAVYKNVPLDILQLILDTGEFDINEVHEDETTALYWSSENSTTEFLLRNGADPNFSLLFSYYTLFAYSSDFELMQSIRKCLLLYRYGADMSMVIQELWIKSNDCMAYGIYQCKRWKTLHDVLHETRTMLVLTQAHHKRVGAKSTLKGIPVEIFRTLKLFLIQ